MRAEVSSTAENGTSQLAVFGPAGPWHDALCADLEQQGLEPPHRLDADPVEAASELTRLADDVARVSRSIDLLVAPDRELPDVDALTGFLESALGALHCPSGAAAALRQVVVLSSAEVHAPSHKHLGIVSEESVAARGEEDAVASRWRHLESEAARLVSVRTSTHADEVDGEDAAGPSASGSLRAAQALTILRPTWTPVPGGRDFASRLFAGSATLAYPGHDPVLQVLSMRDLARAIGRVLQRAPASTTYGVEIFHVAPRGALHLRKALRVAGVRRVVLPRWLQNSVRLASGRGSQAQRAERIRYPFTVSAESVARELDFRPRDTSAEALARLRRPEPREELDLPISDPFGEDPEYIARYQKTLWRYLHDVHWRIEELDTHHLPQAGRAVLVGIHRGLMPWDGVMLHSAIQRHRGRNIRFLIHPSLIKMPFLFNYMTKIGGIPACRENAEWVLERDELLGIFPEGIRGAFTYYRDAYQLKRFGRDEYVRMALRHRAPLVPFVTVGSAEIFPIVAKIDWTWWRRYSEWPTLPIAPPFPFVPIPLPTKWHTRFLEPLPVHEQYEPAAADDRAVVARISEQVQERMLDAWLDLRRRRKHLFWGGLRDGAVLSSPEAAS